MHRQTQLNYIISHQIAMFFSLGKTILRAIRFLFQHALVICYRSFIHVSINLIKFYIIRCIRIFAKGFSILFVLDLLENLLNLYLSFSSFFYSIYVKVSWTGSSDSCELLSKFSFSSSLSCVSLSSLSWSFYSFVIY